jgi:hypothetical protein
MSALRATTLLTLDLLRRFMREGIVLRSLVFPIALSWGTIAVTVCAVVLFRAPANVVLAMDMTIPEGHTEAALLAELEESGWPIERVADPHAWVSSGRATVGTDGETIWMHRASADALAVEGVLRNHLGSSWRTSSRMKKRRLQRSARSGRILVQFIGGLFAFYGVVFGAGSVARDRDAGTLESELAMPVPSWVHGFSRWLAGTLLLSLFFALAVGIFNSLLLLEAPYTLALHGAAACGGASAIGLVVIGRSGLEAGFAGPMSAGLVAVVSLLSFGVGNRVVGAWLPISSLLARSEDGLTPLLMSLAWGVIATAIFTRRTATA